MSFDVEAIRQQFPVLHQEIDGQPLVYLDNAASTQKPQCVIDAITDYYSRYHSNVHRGAHRLADEATRRFENARSIVSGFVNASSDSEIIWTSGTTDSINLVAFGLAQQLEPGQQVLVTEMEHHANLVPWQQACKASGATLVIAPVDDRGELKLDVFKSLLNNDTALVAFPHVSNALGTINPVKEMTAMAKSVNSLVLVDGAQAVAHGGVDVRDIGCDFYAFSGHKLFGPTGTGVLWGREDVLKDWPVYRTGGEMISTVTYQHSEWNELPYRFEAGTPNIAGFIGLGEAVKWFSELDHEAVKQHEQSLITKAMAMAESFEGMRVVGTATAKTGVLSFVMDQGHPADVGFLLDRQGVAIRTGHHCAEPLMQRFGIPGTARASFSIYNTLDEVDSLFAALDKARKMLD